MAVTRAAGKAVSGVKKASTSPKKSQHVSKPASKDIDRTPDEHYIIVNGRKWRATDPAIPEAEFEELKHFLALGRSGSRKSKTKSEDDIKAARQYTALAKLGLGERGQPVWWEDTSEGRKKRWSDALEQLRQLPT
ncbi:hypothetical protein P389DRAFT_197530 [Cystobasidium minutum MCA 4210]|uniref:uncharacterized protein n=1 Tax=Cystobasidium minutum MCA 4210 TaxID=1397322 RepID=UPI0034CD2300|eukprot:jgi/Rhomi1/197530/gm1.5744_g